MACVSTSNTTASTHSAPLPSIDRCPSSMSTASFCDISCWAESIDPSLQDISVWIDSVDSSPQEITSIPAICSHVDDAKEKPRQVKRRIMDLDPDGTPRASKRRRDLDGAPQLPPPSPRNFPSPSPTRSNATPSEISVESHKSGRLSPTKQIMLLEDQQRPILFHNFGDTREHAERPDVGVMRNAIQRLAAGVGIIGYEDEHLDAITATLSSTSDRLQFGYPHANDPTQRLRYGRMPAIAQLERIVRKGWKHDHGSGASEDDWNSGVQLPLLELALETCKHEENLTVQGVKTLAIEPRWLARTTVGLPGRVIDYVVALEPDALIKQAWHKLQPLPGEHVKAWNHATRTLRENPIALNVKTKGPNKSWTDGKSQIAIWTDAWLHRVSLLPQAGHVIGDGAWPAIPLLIAQGHDWHLLIISRDGEKTIVWDQIAVGGSRNCFEAMKTVAVLHWCMDWAETVYRPWFHSLI